MLNVSAQIYATYGREEKYMQRFCWEGKEPLGRPRVRWEVNIKMYHQETGLVTRRLKPSVSE
jgi:hypothetical protein